MYWILIKKDTYVHVTFKDFEFDSKIFIDILKVGIPASLDMFVMSLAMSIYLIFISSIAGEYGIAAFTSGQRLYLFAIMPLTAIGSAVAAVSGSAYGARNADYLSRAHYYGTNFAMAFGLVMVFILVVFAPQLSLIFAYTPETANLVPEITNFLTTSLAWTIIREVIFTVSFTYLFGIVLNWGLIGIWTGLAVGRMLASILNFIYARYTISVIRKEFQ